MGWLQAAECQIRWRYAHSSSQIANLQVRRTCTSSFAVANRAGRCGNGDIEVLSGGAGRHVMLDLAAPRLGWVREPGNPARVLRRLERQVFPFACAGRVRRRDPEVVCGVRRERRYLRGHFHRARPGPRQRLARCARPVAGARAVFELAFGDRFTVGVHPGVQGRRAPGYPRVVGAERPAPRSGRVPRTRVGRP